MLSLLLIALSFGASIGSFFPEDLSTVKWEHAVNSKEKLNSSLKMNDVQMLEADVSLNDAKEPIMAHPPNTTSDLTLEEFLKTVLGAKPKKGVKLDFKSTDAFNASIKMLEKYANQFNQSEVPVWLNADILKGPGGQEPTVNRTLFLEAAKSKFDSWTLSLGWTTEWSGAENYTAEDVQNMNETLVSVNITQPVTFAVRAALAAKSDVPMKSLASINKSTLTVWSSENDMNITYDALRKTIQDIGRKHIFIDMPKDQLKALNSGVQAFLSSACVMLAVGAYSVRFW